MVSTEHGFEAATCTQCPVETIKMMKKDSLLINQGKYKRHRFFVLLSY